MNKLIIILFFLPVFVHAQDGHLMIQGKTGNLYLNHTAAPKENFYSIGRIYNISPKEIAPYNDLALEKGLSLGKAIKIPLKENFIQAGEVAADEVTVPLYHKTAAKETLYALSTNYNKVPAASLKAWNNLKADALSPGQDIIVGYLRVKKDLSSLAQKGIVVPATTTEPKAVETVVIKEPIKVPVKVIPEKVTTVVKTDPVPEKTIVPEIPVVASSKKDLKEGSFKSLYENTGKVQSGMAGVFKSTSGWEDGRFYCLHDAAPRGTVIKITNLATGKWVFAKVLDIMPDLKQNNELTVRLSNAAADALGAGETNFACTITY